jgi:imidazolonepropionase-like amidohydrolase
MNRIHATIGVVCALLSAASSAQPSAAVAFVDVNVVPMDRERVLMHQTVLVRNGEIVALGPRVDIPADARRVEGGGNAWLIPGLADMHTHLASGEDAALYAAAGVTTVLQMGGEGRVEPIPVLRALLAQAPLAPQVFFAFMLDGEQPTSGGWPIHSVDEARFAVRVAKDRQYEFVKVYNGLRAAEFDAIVDESRKAGLAVIGHGVRAVGLPTGLLRGEVMVAHAEEFYYTTFGNQPDASKLSAAVDETRRSGAYVTPNLSAIDAIARQWGRPNVREQLLKDPLVRFMSPYSWLTWATPRRNYDRGTGNFFDVQLSFLRQFVLELSKQGVPLLAGTDSPLIPGLVPGASVNDELRTLVESGLSNYQALAAATRTPGEFIAKFVPGAARFGVIDAGARADLVMLAGNPLERLETLREPLGVMIAGRWHVSEEIAAVLEQNRRNIAAQMQDVISAAAP